jgi:hypothetical protein
VPILLGSFTVSSAVPACGSQMFVPVPERIARRVSSPHSPGTASRRRDFDPSNQRHGVIIGIRGLLGLRKVWNSRGDILTRRATALFSDSSVEIVRCRHKLTPKLVCRPPVAASSPRSPCSTSPAADPHRLRSTIPTLLLRRVLTPAEHASRSSSRSRSSTRLHRSLSSNLRPSSAAAVADYSSAVDCRS